MKNIRDFYDNGNYKDLGIVPTPRHIAEFMVDLLEINDEDVVLDSCLGIGGLVADERIKNIVAVELQPKLAEIAAELLKGKNLNLIVGDSWNPEIIEKINTQKPTKLIINPPYAQDGYPELGFVRRSLDSLQPGGLGVVIVPMSSAIKSDNKTKQLKKEILEKHSLVATFSMPDQLFYPVGVVTIVMLFKAHEVNSKETFFGNLKNDGFEITRTNGRMDTKNLWTDIKQEMFDLYFNKEVKDGLSAYEKVAFDMEWAGEAYIKSNFLVSKEDFIKNIKLYNIFLFKNNLKNTISEEVFETKTINIEKYNFKEFSFDEVFEISRGKGGRATDAKNNPGSNFYIGASAENNGITHYTVLENTEDKNTITVANNGSVGASFFQPIEYLASSDISILRLRNKELNPFIALFLTTLIKQIGESFDYGRKWGITRMRESKISLPVDSNGNPDWQLMKDYIKSLPYSKYL